MATGKTDDPTETRTLPAAICAAATVRCSRRKCPLGRTTCRLLTPEGARTLSSVKFSLRDSLGRRYVGSITSDVTEQRAADEALREADRRKDQFIATLAHELRNPLAPIRTAVAILGRDGAAEPTVPGAAM